jgi:hypothetical protein
MRPSLDVGGVSCSGDGASAERQAGTRCESDGTGGNPYVPAAMPTTGLTPNMTLQTFQANQEACFDQSPRLQALQPQAACDVQRTCPHYSMDPTRPPGRAHAAGRISEWQRSIYRRSIRFICFLLRLANAYHGRKRRQIARHYQRTPGLHLLPDG